MSELCSTCFRSLTGRPQDQVVHGCCQRKVCSQCTAGNARLATYCPFCDDALSALRKRRTDVLKAGDTLFDMDVAQDQYLLSQAAQAQEESAHSPKAGLATTPTPSAVDPPPAYTPAPEFAIGDDPDTDDVAPAPCASKAGTSVLSGAEAPTSPPPPAHSVPEESCPDDTSQAPGLVRYYLQPHDTVAGIALRFRCSRAQVCSINGLPRTAVHTPSVLHTRRYVDLPSIAAEPASNDKNKNKAMDVDGPPSYSDASPEPHLQESFAPRLSPEQHRQAAQVRFQALVLRHMRAEAPGVLVPDARAADVYISLAEAELAPTGIGESGPTALVNLAVSHWMMDSDWERRQRVQGVGPSSTRIASSRGRDSGLSSSSSFLSRLLRAPARAVGVQGK